ncbi:hypothetical protein [Candidatus Enterococcus clewellii]|uniref:Uncharacterized protein n=1 Tax=Candidatus Enterococcus clewellii TaxID=1834193 RepID=A0A242K8P9_9ENTE|nr:hypothetical protein [Enterococcus sp. 9E7_DIV0242]OTP17449.1 hypothetical protein A5888_001587 [Enterococcus sp. 9E7_DIV0242]
MFIDILKMCRSLVLVATAFYLSFIDVPIIVNVAIIVYCILNLIIEMDEQLEARREE